MLPLFVRRQGKKKHAFIKRVVHKMPTLLSPRQTQTTQENTQMPTQTPTQTQTQTTRKTQANGIVSVATTNQSLACVQWPRVIARDGQIQSIRMFLEEPLVDPTKEYASVMVLMGPPATGKTTVARQVIQALSWSSSSLSVCGKCNGEHDAPDGKAITGIKSGKKNGADATNDLQPHFEAQIKGKPKAKSKVQPDTRKRRVQAHYFSSASLFAVWRKQQITPTTTPTILAIDDVELMTAHDRKFLDRLTTQLPLSTRILLITNNPVSSVESLSVGATVVFPPYTIEELRQPIFATPLPAEWFIDAATQDYWIRQIIVRCRQDPRLIARTMADIRIFVSLSTSRKDKSGAPTGANNIKDNTKTNINIKSKKITSLGDYHDSLSQRARLEQQDIVVFFRSMTRLHAQTSIVSELSIPLRRLVVLLLHYWHEHHVSFRALVKANPLPQPNLDQEKRLAFAKGKKSKTTSLVGAKRRRVFSVLPSKGQPQAQSQAPTQTRAQQQYSLTEWEFRAFLESDPMAGKFRLQHDTLQLQDAFVQLERWGLLRSNIVSWEVKTKRQKTIQAASLQVKSVLTQKSLILEDPTGLLNDLPFEDRAWMTPDVRKLYDRQRLTLAS